LTRSPCQNAGVTGSEGPLSNPLWTSWASHCNAAAFLLLAFFEEAKSGADYLIGGLVAAGVNGFMNEGFEMWGQGYVEGH